MIEIYTDGGARRQGRENQIGGYGIVIKEKDHQVELSGAFKDKTNNFMELYAVLKGLTAIDTQKTPIVVYTDSQYVEMGFNHWLESWQKNNWQTKRGKRLLYQPIWQILEEYKNHIFESVRIVRVPSHQGIPLNERADTLATEAMDGLEKQLNISEVPTYV